MQYPPAQVVDEFFGAEGFSDASNVECTEQRLSLSSTSKLTTPSPAGRNDAGQHNRPSPLSSLNPNNVNVHGQVSNPISVDAGEIKALETSKSRARPTSDQDTADEGLCELQAAILCLLLLVVNADPTDQPNSDDSSPSSTNNCQSEETRTPNQNPQSSKGFTAKYPLSTGNKRQLQRSKRTNGGDSDDDDDSDPPRKRVAVKLNVIKNMLEKLACPFAKEAAPLVAYSSAKQGLPRSEMVSAAINRLASGSNHHLDPAELVQLTTDLRSRTPTQFQEYIHSDLGINVNQIPFDDLLTNLEETVPWTFTPWNQSDAEQFSTEPRSSSRSSLPSGSGSSRPVSPRRPNQKWQDNNWPDSLPLYPEMEIDTSPNRATGVFNGDPSLGSSDSSYDQLEALSSEQFSDLIDFTPEFDLETRSIKEAAPSKENEKENQKEKKYLLRVARNPSARKRATSEASRHKRFYFNDMDEFKREFDAWMVRQFHEPAFCWNAWEFENPLRKERLPSQDELFDELEFVMDAYRSERAAFFLVPKGIEGVA
ncbi:hypothetical protein Dda_8289 [Drechslerella dactyloides]|uniref:Uncharacterized protein n=1 Tax=Drechslerella dactyloides TaxID=74499 RepID=A0AAD6ITK7_DREDA|nr:hypothetical protein Dda_8289 [Drechslerella dactyloides]